MLPIVLFSIRVLSHLLLLCNCLAIYGLNLIWGKGVAGISSRVPLVIIALGIFVLAL